MRALIENLLELQNLMLSPTPPSPGGQAEIARRRRIVPPPVLAHFDRLLARRQRAAAVVRHGVCGECHLRIPVGTLASLVAPHDLHLCDSCGCYLLLADEDRPTRSSRSPLPPSVAAAGPPAFSRR